MVLVWVGVFKSSIDSLFFLPESGKASLKCCFNSAVYTPRERESARASHCLAVAQGTSHTAIRTEETEYNSSCCRYRGLCIEILLQE